MPRTVDHGERRALIVDALLRVAAREGLHAVTMRAVAAEASVSLRLVQYYFESKARLMRAALERLEQDSHRRWSERLARRSPRPSARDVLADCLAEALPTDEAGRTFHVLWMSYAALAMTDPELAAEPFADGPNRLERRLTEVLERARRTGELADGIDPAAESAHLLTFSHGLGTSVLVGQRTPDAALSLLHRHLDRLLPTRLVHRPEG